RVPGSGINVGEQCCQASPERERT
ncbi:MAG: hypothetical protein RIT45_2455, partial [Pseudomonadota bacterium]